MAPAPISPERNLRTLQWAFAIGIAALLAMFGGLQAAGVGPSATFSTELRDTLSAVAGGLSAVLIITALLVLRPRVRRRGSRESVEEYWRSPGTAPAVARVYFLLEGAGTLSAIAFFLTSTPLSAMVAVAAIFGLLMCGPSVFSNP